MGSAVARLANWSLTSWKLYWALAFELFLVQDKRLINGSLVPQSSNFTILGPFGTIDVDAAVATNDYAQVSLNDRQSMWVLGQREVVSIEGDVGTLVLRSVSASVTDTLPNPLDVPQNVALYSRAVCIYITSMLSFVVILASLAVIASVSCVEVCNVLVLPRVVGIVWTGRPLLFARSVVALCWGSLDRWGS
ncbi:hypothetical protein DYB25_000769 [Aphanomyces astaci]|uniref:Uncharacterized protein n=1 Tax=Aphanomyces astaci TaxID=112090 RepID=A0A397AW73_APHAT|nr:hypothetical protein DYB25_000769 [Aphanomyces astaci]RHZ40186.1 hypothetical protein DYB26_001275 [Aphanomyces astaci]